jgi:hypothetical protein
MKRILKHIDALFCRVFSLFYWLCALVSAIIFGTIAFSFGPIGCVLVGVPGLLICLGIVEYALKVWNDAYATGEPATGDASAEHPMG